MIAAQQHFGFWWQLLQTLNQLWLRQRFVVPRHPPVCHELQPRQLTHRDIRRLATGLCQLSLPDLKIADRRHQDHQQTAQHHHRIDQIGQIHVVISIVIGQES